MHKSTCTVSMWGCRHHRRPRTTHRTLSSSRALTPFNSCHPHRQCPPLTSPWLFCRLPSKNMQCTSKIWWVVVHSISCRIQQIALLRDDVRVRVQESGLCGRIDRLMHCMRQSCMHTLGRETTIADAYPLLTIIRRFIRPVPMPRGVKALTTFNLGDLLI
jgi:hypothetical protein